MGPITLNFSKLFDNRCAFRVCGLRARFQGSRLRVNAVEGRKVSGAMADSGSLTNQLGLASAQVPSVASELKQNSSCS